MIAKYFNYGIMKIYSMMTVYAAQTGSEIESELEGFKSFTAIYGWILGVSSGMAVVACSLCFIKMMMTTDSKEAGRYVSDLKEVLIAWIVINLVGSLISTAFTMIGDVKF